MRQLRRELIGLLARCLVLSLMAGGTYGGLAAMNQIANNSLLRDAQAGVDQLIESVLDGVRGTGDPRRLHGRIVRVADGDTITAVVGTRRVKVRLLGIDAPESSTLRRGYAECGGGASKQAMERLAAEHPLITLVSDPTQDASDRYGRALAYVVPRGGGPSFQEALLRQGLARVYVFERPFARVARFRQAARSAAAERRGVYAFCGGRFDRRVER